MPEEDQRIKKFYREATVVLQGERYAVALDGKIAKTLRRRQMASAGFMLANACADEWNAQGDFINRETMPLTALLSATIDSDDDDAATWRAETLQYLQTDLLCYRADEPAALLERQNRVWDPYIEFMHEDFGAPLNVTAGIIAVDQPSDSVAAIKSTLDDMSAETAFGVNRATSILGSCILALALWKGIRPVEEIFDASRLDEGFQEERWGIDEEAKARTDKLSAEFLAVARFLVLSEKRA
ncbi:MAG: ATP12 family protein [Pseudomonadota bacterium]